MAAVDGPVGRGRRWTGDLCIGSASTAAVLPGKETLVICKIPACWAIQTSTAQVKTPYRRLQHAADP